MVQVLESSKDHVAVLPQFGTILIPLGRGCVQDRELDDFLLGPCHREIAVAGCRMVAAVNGFACCHGFTPLGEFCPAEHSPAGVWIAVAIQVRSNSRISDPSCLASMRSARSCWTAAPSPCCKRLPFNSTSPRATCNQA